MPRIQDFAGEKVCIQVITPAHSSSAFASLNVLRISFIGDQGRFPYDLKRKYSGCVQFVYDDPGMLCYFSEALISVKILRTGCKPEFVNSLLLSCLALLFFLCSIVWYDRPPAFDLPFKFEGCIASRVS